ncbi:MAG: polysaccharide deacetylase family protein [Pirellulales bacterium]|nr:polysaccharide deacetylase family protein [Pirellulales bacterium]
MHPTRREFLGAAGATAVSLALPLRVSGGEPKPKSHIVTLSFDDGFKNSSIKTAEIYEKHKLSACINVVASAHRKDFRPPDYHDVPRGDFALWNELRARGHEVMPHSFQHANLQQFSFEEGKDLIRRCLDVFSRKLKGFEPKKAVYSFAYNASTPKLEAWLPTQVMAFRTSGGAINPWPRRGQVKLTCTSFGPGNCEHAIDREIDKLLAQQSGWMIFNTHGLDDEGWGPIRAAYLDRLLERLVGVASVDVLPAGAALSKYVDQA